MEAFLKIYCTELSLLLPIYDRGRLMAALEEQYVSDTELPDTTWIISFNNILLQTLATKLNAC